MRAIVQRSQESSVTVLGKVVGSIKSGLVVLVGYMCILRKKYTYANVPRYKYFIDIYF